MELKDRERKFDVNKLSPAEVDNLSVQIGEKITEICDKAAVEINTILKIYGASAKVAIAFDEMPDAMKQNFKETKKRARKPKQGKG